MQQQKPTAFLRQVIDAYTTPQELRQLPFYCFVTPSRRGALHMQRHLHERLDELGTPAIEPRFISMSELIAAWGHGVEPSRQEELCLLYNVYCGIMARKGITPYTYDRFRFWGEMIINDFDDIDKSLADGPGLLKNVKNINELQADYLTDEQREVLSHYWRLADEDMRQSSDTGDDGVKTFWRHVSYRDGKEQPMSQKFISLWSLLQDLYKEYREALKAHRLMTTGMAYRRAAQSIKDLGVEDLRYRRYIFVGFNVLSTAEIHIMKHLQALGRADFYWDIASPALWQEPEKMRSHTGKIDDRMLNRANRASRYVGCGARDFPSRYPLPYVVGDGPDIHITACGGATTQAKMAGRQLNEWLTQKAGEKDAAISHPEDAINTAVVVNDPALLIPLLHSIPSLFTSVNISLGVPRRHTAASVLINTVINLQLKARAVKGRKCFYYEDVKSLIEQPYIRGLFADDHATITKTIYDRHLFNYPADELETTELGFIFNVPRGDDADEVLNYMTELLQRLILLLSPEKSLEAMLDESGATARAENEAINLLGNAGLDVAVFELFLEEVKEMQELLTRYKITVTDNTYWHLVRNIVNSGELTYVGEPLKGLQVVGMTQTRSLDFDNVILLSMNERIFPRRLSLNSFIPNTLRRGYDLPTLEQRDSITSYAFWRLLSRASRVRIFYDASARSQRHGEESRFIKQLQYLKIYPGKITRDSCELSTIAEQPQPLVVAKDADMLAPYREGGDKYLSASALKTYLSCSMHFYLQYVRRLADNAPLSEMMDDITFGQSIHGTLEAFYKYLREIRTSGTGAPATVTVDQGILDDATTPGSALNRFLKTAIHRAVNKEFNLIPCDILPKDPALLKNKASLWLDKPISGHAAMVRDQAFNIIIELLEQEKAFTPFEFVDAEMERKGVWHIQNGLDINFKMKIDRVDSFTDVCGNKKLRFVDYKTGSDKLKVSSVQGLFNGKHTTQAILQLLTYCEAFNDLYSEETPDDGIMPVIYQLRDLRTEGLKPITYSGRPLLSHNDVHDEFREMLNVAIAEIFNLEKPFTQTNDLDACKFCSFADICGRVVNKDPLKTFKSK